MKKEIFNSGQNLSVCSKTMDQLKKNKPKTDLPFSETEYLKIREDLDVHQIELKLQNNELLLAKEQADLAMRKYVDLFDFAPSAYFMISKQYEIIELNLSAAKLLGKERSRLIKKSFMLFVSNDSLSICNAFLYSVFTCKIKESCEIEIITTEKKRIHAYIEAIVTQNEEQCFLTLVDISQTKDLEQALYKSREDLIEAQRIAHIGSWKWNLKTGEVSWSDEMYRIFGIDKNTYKGKLGDAISTVVHPDDRHIVLPSVATEFTKKKAIEYRIILPDKSIRNICVETSETSFYENAETLFLAGTAQDITERKQAENALIESEGKFRNLIELAVDGIIIGSSNGLITNANSCFCTMSGRSREYLIGKHLLDLFAKECIEATPLRMDSLARGEIVVCERDIIRPDGTSVTVEMRIKMMPDKSYQSIFHDITYRVKNELVLTENINKIAFQNEKLAQINKKLIHTNEELLKSKKIITESEIKFKTIIDFTYDWEYWADQNDQIIYMSPSCERISGYSPEEFISDNFLLKKIIHADDSKLFDDHLQYVNSTEHFREASEIELKIIKKNGSVAYIGHSCTPVINDNGDYLGRRVSNRDITEHKLMRIQIQEQNAELIKLNSDKNRFMAILGHDLRSPFNALLGFSTLLKKNIHSYDFEKIKKTVNIINDSLSSYYVLLSDLLAWSRSQSGNIPFEPQKICFAAVCNIVVENFELSLLSKDITVNYHFTSDIEVFADINMLKTVLNNLISNAIKFTNKTGKIDIFAEQHNSNVIITIADNGVGIPIENIKILFDSSQKNSTRGTESEYGTGLGLILCQDFIEKHGGKIWAESDSGSGSRFYFTLPTPSESFNTGCV